MQWPWGMSHTVAVDWCACSYKRLATFTLLHFHAKWLVAFLQFVATSKYFISMAKSFGGTWFIPCMELVHISESPLWEVPLYITVRQVIAFCSCFAAGGSNGSEYLSSVECYDPSKMKWVPVTNLPTARFGAAAIALSKRDHIHSSTSWACIPEFYR